VLAAQEQAQKYLRGFRQAKESVLAKAKEVQDLKSAAAGGHQASSALAPAATFVAAPVAAPVSSPAVAVVSWPLHDIVIQYCVVYGMKSVRLQQRWLQRPLRGRLRLQLRSRLLLRFLRLQW